jgi:hypothetical protein
MPPNRFAHMRNYDQGVPDFNMDGSLVYSAADGAETLGMLSRHRLVHGLLRASPIVFSKIYSLNHYLKIRFSKKHFLYLCILQAFLYLVCTL